MGNGEKVLKGLLSDRMAPQKFHVLIPGTWDHRLGMSLGNVTLHGKKGLLQRWLCSVPEMGGFLHYPWVLNATTWIFIRRRQREI